MNNEEIKKLAKSLMFKVSDEEANIINQEFELFLKQVDKLNLIDTNDIKPLDYPFEDAIGQLREDVASEVLSVEDVLSNTENTKNNMVTIPKVVL